MDVVRAGQVLNDPDSTPEVLDVIRKSGHRTLRISFPDEVDQEDIDEVLSSLEDLETFVELLGYDRAAIEVPPAVEFEQRLGKLQQWGNNGLLEFAPSEARIENSFEYLPGERPDP